MKNPFQLLKAEREALKQRLRLYQEYQTLFSSPEGHDVLHDLLRECGVFSTSQNANPHQTAFNEGKRFVALFILNRLRMDNLENVQRLLMEKARAARDPEPTDYTDNDTPPVLT